jgi:polyisoprenyl-phosphate glycosyltransferase
MNRSVPLLVSIVAPCFNEAECLTEFHRVLSGVVSELPYDFEFILVDDGSTDATVAIAGELARADARVRVISFSRNFGHQAALLAGFDAARGEAVITMDSDLQHPPALIPELLTQWKEGADIVYTVRRETADAGLWKRLTSRGFYWLINRASVTPIRPGAADFRLMGKAAADSFRQLREYHRFNRGLVSWLGFDARAVEFDAPARFAGQSKYSALGMLRFAVTGLVSFSVLPLRMMMALGFGMAVFALTYIVYALYVFFILKQSVQGWASSLITTLLIGGVQLISLGLVGEYVGRIYEEIKGRPIYVVRKRIGFEDVQGESR